LAGALPISPTGDLRIFGNGMVVGGVFHSTGGGADLGLIGPDMSVGIQYLLTPTIVFDARYRALVEFVTNPSSGGAKYVVNQGPLVGLNIKF
jgi:hypothetical protein